MAYTINKTDGTILASVNDGVLDTTSSMSLIGRNYQSYGEAFNESLVKLLENSSSASSPTAPLEGELWWDKTNDRLKVYTGVAWVNVGVESSSSAPSTGPPTPATAPPAPRYRAGCGGGHGCDAGGTAPRMQKRPA